MELDIEYMRYHPRANWSEPSPSSISFRSCPSEMWRREPIRLALVLLPIEGVQYIICTLCTILVIPCTTGSEKSRLPSLGFRTFDICAACIRVRRTASTVNLHGKSRQEDPFDAFLISHGGNSALQVHPRVCSFVSHFQSTKRPICVTMRAIIVHEKG